MKIMKRKLTKSHTRAQGILPHEHFLNILQQNIFQTEEVKSLSCVRLFATLWPVAYQAPPSVGFSRQEYWSRLLFPSSGDLPNPGIEPRSPTLLAEALPSEPPGKPVQTEEAFT